MTPVAERNRYRMRFTLEGRHLHVRVVGHKGDLETTIACWQEIAAEVRRTGAVTLLVEDDMDGPPVPPEVLPDFLQALDGRGFTAAPRIGTPGQYVFERAFVEK